MLFTAHKRRSQYTPQIYGVVPYSPPTQAKAVLPEPVPQPEPKKKSMKWGQPTWFLFHTLAEKVRPECFAQIRAELLNTISTICSTLPCPDCANHAKQYMAGINFNAIQTKEQLKDLLFTFHNDVNRRKQFPLFPRSELDAKYVNANTVAIIQNFMVHYVDKHASIHMIANDFYRSRIAAQLKAWFLANIQYFDI